MSARTRVDLLIRLLFLVSGLTGLIYQVAWARLFVVVFGNTTQAVATVLAAFMGGLALGSLLIGRLGDRLERPVMAYGWLEILIGLYALAVPAMLAGLEGVYAGIFVAQGNGTTLILVRFLFSFLVVLIPTTLMGGTLPVLGKFVAREIRKAGRGIGGLYAINTLGAVAGTILAAFVLLEAIGVGASLRLAAGGSLGVGVIALLVGRRLRPAAEPEVRPVDRAPADVPFSRGTAAIVLWGFAISGGVALADEVLYTRVLVFTLGCSAQSFGLMLSAFLAGLALGSAVFARWVDRWKRPEIAFGIVEVGIGVAVLASVAVLTRADVFHHQLGILKMGGGDILRNRGSGFLLAALVLLPATFLMGATFPLVTRFFVRRWEDVSAAVGRLYFWNTIGAVAGSLLAGFLLVPRLGTVRSFALAASVNIAIGALVLVGRRRPGAGVVAALAVFALGIAGSLRLDPAAFTRTFNIGHDASELVFVREGVNGTVTVHRYPDYDLIAVDGIDVAGTSFMLRITQKLQAHLPVLLASNRERVAHIGFGSGETLRTLTLHDIPRIDGIEVCPDVIEGARRFFSEINRDVFGRPEVHVILMDGKNYVRLTDRTYDAILTDSVYPGVGEAGSALYTYDHFAAGREKLRPGGILSCWMPLDVSNADLKLVLRAFHEAFPEMAVWYGYGDVTQHALLVGRKDAPIEIDWRTLTAAWNKPAVRSDLSEILIETPEDLASCLLLDSKGVEILIRDVPLNTDDRPLLEFGVARRGQALNYMSANIEEMLAVRADPVEHLVGVEEVGGDPTAIAADIRRRVRAATHISRGHVAMAVRDRGRAYRQYTKALEADPDNRVARLLAGRLDREIELGLAAAASSEPRDLEAVGTLPEVERLMTRGDYAAALATLEAEIERRPDDAELRGRIGECCLRLDRPADARVHLEKAIALDDGNAGYPYLLGLALEKLGEVEKARGAYERAIERNAWDYRARTNLGQIYLAAGETERARGQFQAAHEIVPGKPFPLYNVAATWAAEGDWEKAQRACEEALTRREAFVPAHVLLGDALAARGDENGARESWQRALALRPDDPEIRKRLGSP